MARLVALLIGCLIATSLLAAARVWSDDGVSPLSPRFGGPAEKEIAERRTKIRTEINRLDDGHPWAGEYYQGDGRGVNVELSLAPIAGFAFEWHGCTGLYDRNFGAVHERSGRLEFDFTFPNDRRDFHGLAPVLVPIPWGDRRYLVPQSDLERFCKYVNSGWEPRSGVHGFFLLRRGDEAKPAHGLPSVPSEMRSLLLESPIEATVIRVGESWSEGDERIRTRLTLDKGSKHGVTKGIGMKLMNGDTYLVVTVEEVLSDSCSAIMTSEKGKTLSPKEGWKFSSKVWN